MGNKSSLLLRQEEIAQIQEDTGCKCFFSTFFFHKWLNISCTLCWCPCKTNFTLSLFRLNQSKACMAFITYFFVFFFQLHQIKLSVCIRVSHRWIVLIVEHCPVKTSFAFPNWPSIRCAIELFTHFLPTPVMIAWISANLCMFSPTSDPSERVRATNWTAVKRN